MTTNPWYHSLDIVQLLIKHDLWNDPDKLKAFLDKSPYFLKAIRDVVNPRFFIIKYQQQENYQI